MTDERFDTLLKTALAPEEEAPAFRGPIPLKRSRKRVWPGYLAACLCFMACTGLALRFLPREKGTPESAYGSSGLKAESDLFHDFADIPNATTPDDAPPMPSAPTEPTATLTDAELSAILAIAEAHLGKKPDNYAILGGTERYLSVRAESAKDAVIFTLNREDGTEASLDQVLEEFSLPDAEGKDFYIDHSGQLVLE